MKSNEIEKRQKAGVIPYCFNEDNEMFMMFMVPSDPKYGETEFQIAKGGVELGENLQEAGLREAKEELGLKMSNVVQVKSLGATTITGLDETYLLTVFLVEVKNPDDFGQPHFETGQREWLTLDQFKAIGRRNQLPVVMKVSNFVEIR